VIVSPSTVTVLGASGLGAGPFTTEPSVIEYLLPWQSQLIVSVTSATGQPAWVQIEVKALNWPAVGWVMTACASAKTWPPPTGMSAVLADRPPPALVAEGGASAEP
jgi:hypothetical protein